MKNANIKETEHCFILNTTFKEQQNMSTLKRSGSVKDKEDRLKSEQRCICVGRYVCVCVRAHAKILISYSRMVKVIHFSKPS